MARLALVAGILLVLLVLLGGTAHAKPREAMRLGYVVSTIPPDTPDLAYDRARSGGARIIRVTVPWLAVARTRPAEPADPADPVYDWSLVDERARAAAQRRLRVLLLVSGAPRWAEGRDRPAGAREGAWRPGVRAFGDFMRAVATRYSGRVRGVPRVRLYQVWNEPNLAFHLAPQRGAPKRYRRMLNAAYRAVKSVSRRTTIVTAGTAPYGDDAGARTRPVRFWRRLLCVGGRRLTRRRCPGGRARFDAWAHHPYGIGGPRRSALDPENVAIPDLGRLTRVMRAAVRRRAVRPRGPKPLWVTEFSWDSRPPDPDGVPARRHARWLEGALFEFWRAGVHTALWLQVLDQPPVPSFGASLQSATHLIDGTPKPAARAYRFPFVADRPGRRALVWGLAPRRGPVRIQRRSAGGWRTVARARAGRGRVFTARVRSARGSVLRARQRGVRSVPWIVGRDGN